MKSNFATLLMALCVGIGMQSVAHATVDVERPLAKIVFGDSDALAAAEKYDMTCNDLSQRTVEHISVSYKLDYETAKDPIREQQYFIVSCLAGAYNDNSVLLRVDYDDQLRAVSFASPEINRKGKIIGFSADVVTGALSYNAKKQTLTSFSKGRGIGDLYVSGTYQIFETQVILREYTIDNVPGDAKVVPPIYKSTEPMNR